MSDVQDHEERIRDIAYGLWEKEGEPEGRSDEFWHRAVAIAAQEDAPDHEPPIEPSEDDSVDVDMEQSFPASDPPSFSPSTAGGKV